MPQRKNPPLQKGDMGDLSSISSVAIFVACDGAARMILSRWSKQAGQLTSLRLKQAKRHADVFTFSQMSQPWHYALGEPANIFQRHFLGHSAEVKRA
jgi:hypothetical protein